MPRFNVSITFNLQSEIEPEGVRFDRDYPEGVSDLEDNSYWYRSEVTSDGGQVNFVVEAEDAQAAEAVAIEIVADGNEVEDDLSFTWLITDAEYSVEEIEEPMTLDRAIGIVKQWLDGRDQDDELSEALDFMLAQFTVYETRLVEANERYTRIDAEVRRLDTLVARQAGEIDRLTAGPDGSEAPTEVAQ